MSYSITMLLLVTLLGIYSLSSVFVMVFESNLSLILAFPSSLDLYEIGFGITASFLSAHVFYPSPF